MTEARRPAIQSTDIDEIQAGAISDVYFERTVEIIKATGVNKPVRAEFIAKRFPPEWPAALFTGLEECLALLAGRGLSVRAMPEGTVFHPYQPVLEISGSYLSFCTLETELLGFLCQPTGVATKAARVVTAAGDRPVISFGARRVHPAVAAVLERAAYIGGCAGVSLARSARVLDIDPAGTMPHSLVLLFGDTVRAAEAFDQVIDPTVPRIVLIDTFGDEKFEAIRVAEALGDKLAGIRFDTPGTRRGDFRKIIEEVRWELDLRGFQRVQLVASGGLDEAEVANLRHIVDVFGVGTSIIGAPLVDYSMDIVEIDGKPIAKRGKESGAKQVWRCPNCGSDLVLPLAAPLPECPCGSQQQTMEPLLQQIMTDGTLNEPLPEPEAIRTYVHDHLALLTAPASAIA